MLLTSFDQIIDTKTINGNADQKVMCLVGSMGPRMGKRMAYKKPIEFKRFTVK